jgi:hypothetical protein
MTRNFETDRHALYVGWVLGIAQKVGLDARPEIDAEGNYTARIIIPWGSHRITVTVPPPPDDWTVPAGENNKEET